MILESCKESNVSSSNLVETPTPMEEES